MYKRQCKNSHTTAAALRAGYRDAAERNLRSMLASSSIAEAENITVSTLEVNNEYRRLSQLQDTPEADIRRVLSPDTLDVYKRQAHRYPHSGHKRWICSPWPVCTGL